MMKMLIELDRKKIEKEGKYKFEKMQSAIDELFAEEHMYKNAEGMYDDGDFSRIGGIVVALSETKWFMENVKKWLWYEQVVETDNPTEEDFSVENVLEEMRGKMSMVG